MALEKALGFRSVLIPANGFAQNVDNGKGKTGINLAFGQDNGLLLPHVRSGTRAVAPLDLHVDRRLLEEMKANGTILCVPMFPILSSYGIGRSRKIYQVRLLVDNARSRRIPTAFITLAPRAEYMCSRMQLQELAKMMGMTDQESRDSISIVTKEVF